MCFVLVEELGNTVLVTFSEEELKPMLQQFLNEMTKEVRVCH